MAKATTPTAGKKKTFRKKEKKNIPVGIVHIAASFNNTLISITDTEGNLIALRWMLPIKRTIDAGPEVGTTSIAKRDRDG